MRRQLSGTFLAQHLGEGAWRLSRRGPNPIDVFLRGADSAAGEALSSPEVLGLCIEWRADAVGLTLNSAPHCVLAGARSAIVHEPLPQLYEILPLVRLDARTRRFWRNVFRLVRIPGGRRLLGVLARRSRGRG
jgi:hypothetical protein